jgi:hypothetical protein
VRLKCSIFAFIALLSTFVTSVLAPSPSWASTSTATPAQITQTQSWVAQVKNDYGSLDGVVLALLEAFQSWQSGTLKAATITTTIDTNLAAVVQSTKALDKQAPLPWTGQILRQYQAAADLYLNAIQVERVASLLRTGALQRQLQDSEARLRELGDRTYSLATEELAPFQPKPASDPYVITIKPPSVPNWAAEHLLPGRPLDTGKPPKGGRRVTGSSWSSVTSRISIPSATKEAAQIRSASTQTLRSLSDGFYVTAADFATAPLPPDGKSGLDGLRLALLADSEAMRVSEASRFVKSSSQASALRSAAQNVAVLSRLIWSTSSNLG